MIYFMSSLVGYRTHAQTKAVSVHRPQSYSDSWLYPTDGLQVHKDPNQMAPAASRYVAA